MRKLDHLGPQPLPSGQHRAGHGRPDHRLWETAVLFHLRDAFRAGDKSGWATGPNPAPRRSSGASGTCSRASNWRRAHTAGPARGKERPGKSMKSGTGGRWKQRRIDIDSRDRRPSKRGAARRRVRNLLCASRKRSPGIGTAAGRPRRNGPRERRAAQTCPQGNERFLDPGPWARADQEEGEGRRCATSRSSRRGGKSYARTLRQPGPPPGTLVPQRCGRAMQ